MAPWLHISFQGASGGRDGLDSMVRLMRCRQHRNNPIEDTEPSAVAGQPPRTADTASASEWRGGLDSVKFEYLSPAPRSRARGMFPPWVADGNPVIRPSCGWSSRQGRSVKVPHMRISTGTGLSSIRLAAVTAIRWRAIRRVRAMCGQVYRRSGKGDTKRGFGRASASRSRRPANCVVRCIAQHGTVSIPPP